MRKKCKQILNEFLEELQYYFGQSENDHADKVILRSNAVYVMLSMVLLLNAVGLYWNSGVVPGLNDSADAYKYAAVTEIDKNTIVPGDITDRNDTILVKTEAALSASEYADDTAYSQVIGFTGPSKLVKGNQVSEAQNDYRLMRYLRDYLYQTTDIDGTKGCQIQLTLDHGLQMAVQEALLTQMGLTEKGSAVVLNAKTGEILAMVSFPTFNVNDLEEGLQDLNHSEEVMEMHYPITHKDADPAGSIFKLVVLIAMLDNGLETFTVLDNGYMIGDAQITNIYGDAWKEIGYEEALISSSNVFYSKAALELGADVLEETAKKFGIGEYLELDFGSVKSNWSLDEESELELAYTAFGQGKLELSTLSAAMIGAAIANDGVLVEPYMIKQITDANGNPVTDEDGNPIGDAAERTTVQVTSKETADKVEQAMLKTGESYGYSVAAKSGTAQNGDERDTNNAWYLSFSGDYVVVVNQCKTYKGGIDLAPIANSIYEYLEDYPVK